MGRIGIRIFISGEQGNRGTKAIWGTGNIKFNKIMNLGNKGKCRFFQGNKGTGTPSTLGRPLF